MYVIKMRTIISYLAVIAITFASIGIIKIYDDRTVLSNAEAAPTEQSINLPIIMYHNIIDNSSKRSKYIISPTDFENDLKYLKENGYNTIVIKDLLDYVYDNKPLPEKPVMLTFDDGYYNNYVYAYPLLKKYNCCAVISPIGYYTDLYSKNGEENPNYSHITWKHINEMIKSGNIEMQSHSYDMHSTDKGRNGTKKKRGESVEEYTKALSSDIKELQDKFTQNTSYTPTAFVYPFGSVSKESYKIIKEMGFKASLSCTSGMNKITRRPECLYMMKRYLRPSNKSVRDTLK